MLIFVVCALKLECLLFALEGRYEKRRGRGRGGGSKGGEREGGRGEGGREGRGRGERGREGGKEGGRGYGREMEELERGMKGEIRVKGEVFPWKQLTAEL